MKSKIMVVEDSPINMRLIEMTLRTQRYTLLKAVDGEQALNIARMERPDLIIMDIQLPGMSGLEVTRRLREIPSFKQTPIIGITAYAMKGDREKVLESGCDAYMSKPIDTRELPEVIHGMLSQKQEGTPGAEGGSGGEEGTDN
ncbi:response regulator [Chloroflexota bacterium]